MKTYILSIGLVLAVVVLGPLAESRLPAQLPIVAESAGQDTTPDIKKFAQAKVTAASKAYQIAEQRLTNNVPGAKPEDVYTWSVRGLKAQQELSSKPADHIAACSEHLKRMQDLAKRVKQMLLVGAPESAGGSAPAADFYVAEAEFWLAKAKASAKQADK